MKILVLGFGFLVPAAASCLGNATAPEDRKLLVNSAIGESYPVGIWGASWAAGEATSYMLGILVEEIFGFNVTYGWGPGTADGYYAMAACSEPNNKTDRGCKDSNTAYYHIHTEAWMQGYKSTLDFVRSLPTSPKTLSSMGYTGFISLYFTEREMQAAYEGEGLALDFWTGFDSTWNQPWTYFDNPSAVNRAELMPCSESNFFDSTIVSQYATFSGDTAGIVTQPDGSVVGNCQDGYFWQSPACRSDSSKCIVFFTGGLGYSLGETMQKAAKWNIPMAIGIGADWANFTTLPTKHRSLFYWWVPDPTFLDMNPSPTTFPEYDKAQWALGDQSSASSQLPIHKMVSHDFGALSPRLERFVDNFQIDLDSLNALLLEQKGTGDDWETAACKWLQSNPTLWQTWIPDDTECFPSFGLYNSLSGIFVADRSDRAGLGCQACPSGTFSSQLVDDVGTTYICQACPPGTSQPSGASLSCEPCAHGQFQDESGQLGCKRCAVGTYQNEEGGATCKLCPANSETLGLGSVAFADCGCKDDFIDVAEGGNLTCQACQSGMSCPAMGTKQSLLSGSHPLGSTYVPEILEGHFVTRDQPLEVYKCGKVFQCPGGLPETCAGGLDGTPCAECPPGQTFTDKCEDCGSWRQILWVFATIGVFVFLTVSYYLMTSKVTAKASVLFTTTCAFGMLVSLLQSIGIIGTMTVDFPVNIKGVLSFLSIFVLDLESFGFACIAGASTAWRYSVSVIFFPCAVGWLAMNFAVSKVFPKYAWDKTKVISCMGQVLQVSFSTMSAVALAPLTCYTHPNEKQSVLKYPNILCGSEEHTLMLIGGLLLLSIGVLGFLAVCTYAAIRVPTWSAMEKHHYVRCFRFLVFRFRLDSWWFGVPLLTRGPLISLPIVLATDYPGIQTIWITMILLTFLAVQALAWPWKVPLLNALDCWMSFCIMVLVAGSALYLEPIVKAGVTASFVNAFSTAVMVLIFSAIGVMILTALSALVHRAAMGGGGEFAFINLGRSPDSDHVAMKLKEMAELLAAMQPEELEKAMDALSIFDTRRILGFMTMLGAEVLIDKNKSFSYGTRVNSRSFSAQNK